MNPNNSSLSSVLTRAKHVGFLGPGDPESHADHATRFNPPRVMEAGSLLDLGSGGGVPALPVLLDCPNLTGVLLDTAQRRCSFLVWAVCELGLDNRVEVVCGRAEELAHDARFRSQFSWVTARGFGPPSWTFECAIGFMAEDATLVVSEPPEIRNWSDKATLENLGIVQHDRSDGVVRFRRVGEVPSSLPRKPKVAKNSPLLDVS